VLFEVGPSRPHGDGRIAVDVLQTDVFAVHVQGLRVQLAQDEAAPHVVRRPLLRSRGRHELSVLAVPVACRPPAQPGHRTSTHAVNRERSARHAGSASELCGNHANTHHAPRYVLIATLSHRTKSPSWSAGILPRGLILRYSSVCVSPERGDTGLSSYSKPSSFSNHCAHPSQPAVNQQHAQGVPLLQALTTQRPERNSGLPHSTRAIAAVLYVGRVLLTSVRCC
jgi:hypothetical protein